MKINTKLFEKINRQYLITSAELRQLLNLEGEIEGIGLSVGRSPNDIEKGKSPEKDTWYINTKQVK